MRSRVARLAQRDRARADSVTNCMPSCTGDSKGVVEESLSCGDGVGSESSEGSGSEVSGRAVGGGTSSPKVSGRIDTA